MFGSEKIDIGWVKKKLAIKRNTWRRHILKVTERNKNGSVDQIMADIWDSYKITKCDITEEGQWIELPKHCTKDKKI